MQVYIVFTLNVLGKIGKEIKLKMRINMRCLYLAPTHNITSQ